MPGAVLAELFELWNARERRDEYFGTLVNAYIEKGGRASGVRAGTSYVDVGTLNGYRHAMDLLKQAHDGHQPVHAPPEIARKLWTRNSGITVRRDV
jgi:glucose-1-phosphate thymidylyltransferase